MEIHPPDSQPPEQRPKSPVSAPRRASGFSGITWLLIFLVVLLILPYVAERVQFAVTRGRQRARAEVATVALEGMPKSSSRFAWVVKKIEPCVVGIETSSELLGQSFGDEWSYLPQAGEGSGVIVDEEGYVVTNSHVVEGAMQVTVKLSDGRTIGNVRIVGADPKADLAVLKIEAGGLSAANWGDSDQLEVGDEVLAIGNPYRLARTVTAGIISAKGRPGVVGPLTQQEFLQTDAAVNPGNSGGPLVDINGEVVGINTAIVGESYRGISFAIPSRIAQDVYQRLRTTGKIEPRGWLGVTMEEITDREAAALGLEKVYGVVVLSVVRDSPAHKAGIEPNDVILTWNGLEIHSSAELSLAVVRTRIGSEATVELVREGQRLEVTVEVGQRPLFPKR